VSGGHCSGLVRTNEKMNKLVANGKYYSGPTGVIRDIDCQVLGISCVYVGCIRVGGGHLEVRLS
jgi:hypothetical protein